MKTAIRRLGLRLHRLALRTGPALGPLWRAAYSIATRLYGTYLLRGVRPVALYARGSLGSGEAVPGLSDLDLAVVVPPGAREPVRRRWRRARRLFGDLLFDWPLALELQDLHDCAAPARSHALAGPGGALYWGPAAAEERVWTSERPELYAPTAGWRLLHGEDLRPPEGPRSGPERGEAAWLLLQQLWRLLFPVCLDSSGPRSARLCWKLYAEPARFWLWLARGERFEERTSALRRLASVLPEEAESLAGAEALGERLHRSPRPPLEDATRYLVRMSNRIAGLLAAEADAAGNVQVQLDWGGPEELLTPLVAYRGNERPAEPLPLVDWRALVLSRLPDDVWALHPGDPGDPAVLAAAAIGPTGAYRLLPAGGLVVLPTSADPRARLRAVQCRVSDPVTFALLEGLESAAFPDLAGWSARDWARRAVSEHQVALREPHPEGHSGHDLARLIGAARAALLLESMETERPVLRLTVASTLRALADRGEEAVATAALESYAGFSFDWRPVHPSVLAGLRRIVQEFPVYGGARHGSAAPTS